MIPPLNCWGFDKNHATTHFAFTGANATELQKPAMWVAHTFSSTGAPDTGLTWPHLTAASP